MWKRKFENNFFKKILYNPLMGCSSFANYCFQMGVTVMGFAEHFGLWLLTLFHLGGGLFDPLYHESVCRIYRPRTRFTKIHDFVPFGICQDPVKLLLKFFSKKFEILDVKIFWGSSSIRKKWKNFEKFFFEKKAKIWNPYGQRVSQKKFE